MTKVSAQEKKSVIHGYMVKPQKPRKIVSWRDYIIPTRSKKKRRISETVDRIVYSV